MPIRCDRLVIESPPGEERTMPASADSAPDTRVTRARRETSRCRGLPPRAVRIVEDDDARGPRRRKKRYSRPPPMLEDDHQSSLGDSKSPIARGLFLLSPHQPIGGALGIPFWLHRPHAVAIRPDLPSPDSRKSPPFSWLALAIAIAATGLRRVAGLPPKRARRTVLSPGQRWVGLRSQSAACC